MGVAWLWLCCRTCGETFLADTGLGRESGELRDEVRHAGEGEGSIDADEIEVVFFLTDNGATLGVEGGGGETSRSRTCAPLALGVASVLPIGKSGWRLLRGIDDLELVREAGVGSKCRLSC